MITEIL